MEEDKNGWLWIATSDHVLRVSRDRLLSSAAKAGEVREYDQTDGLESTEGVKRSRSVVSDSAGRIWFSLSNGFSVVDPHLVSQQAPRLAIAHIEAVFVDGSPLKAGYGSRSRVATQDHFYIRGPGPGSPERVRFRYFLEKFRSHLE